MGRERIVVVGGGAAGLRAAERLRELDFGGELVVVGEEPYRTYHRPGLTKHLLTGSARPRDLVLPVLTDLDAVWRYGVRATHLEPDEHVLHLPGGEEIGYDGLVIATGAQARHLPGAPRHDPRVHVVRTVADAVAVQKNLRRGRGGLAVVGSGFLAGELASAARALGRDATIITRGRTLLDRVPGDDLGETVTALHEAHGVRIVTEAEVHHWVRQPDGVALHLTTGQVVVASCVVLAVGAVPAVSWLRGSGLILDDGVMCDPTCHAIGAEDIVVAGDVARWPNLRFDSVPRRVEHWLNAVEMGRAAAENLLAGQTSATPFTPVPRFWTDQHGLRIQGAGLPALARNTVSLSGRVDLGDRVTGYVADGELVGVVAFDSPRAMLHHTAELTTATARTIRDRHPSRPTPPHRTPTEPPVPAAAVPAVRRPTPPRLPEVRVAPADMTGWIPAIRSTDSYPSTPAMAFGHAPRDRFPQPPPVDPPEPGRPVEHPSFPSLPAVGGPPAAPFEGHPSFPSLPAVDRPPVVPGEGHPSFPSLPAVDRPPVVPGEGHPSFPSLPAVDRPPVGPGEGHPSFPSLPAVGGPPVRFAAGQRSRPSLPAGDGASAGPVAGHPSFPSMPAVGGSPQARFDGRPSVPFVGHPSFPSLPAVSRDGADPWSGRQPSFPLRRPTDAEMPPLRTTDSVPSLPAVGRPPGQGRAARRRAAEARAAAEEAARRATGRPPGAHRKPEPAAGPPPPELSATEVTAAIPPVRANGPLPFPSTPPPREDDTVPGLPPIRSTDSVPGMPPATPVDTFRRPPPARPRAFPPVPSLGPTGAAARPGAGAYRADPSPGRSPFDLSDSPLRRHPVPPPFDLSGSPTARPAPPAVAPGGSSARLRPVPPPAPASGRVPARDQHPPSPPPDGMAASPAPPSRGRAAVTPPRGRATPHPPDAPAERGLDLPPPPAPAGPPTSRSARRRRRSASTHRRAPALPPPGTVAALPPASPVPSLADPSRYEEIMPTD